MTDDQFAALAELLQMRTGASRDAARLVLVDGIRQAEAARRTGLTPTGVGNAVRRVGRTLELARVAVGVACDN